MSSPHGPRTRQNRPAPFWPGSTSSPTLRSTTRFAGSWRGEMSCHMYNTDVTDLPASGEAQAKAKDKRFWIVHLTRAWYVLCLSDELKREPIRRKLFGTPIVLFRGADGRVGALVDRCPHRSVPLSLGRVVGQQIECEYHGWQFDTGGNRVRVP